MNRFFIVSLCTLILIIIVYVWNNDVFQTDHLPYDDEQSGLDDQIVINFSHVVAENTPKGVAATRFAELVKEKTNGKVIVQVYPDGILYNDDTEFEALKENKVQMIAPTFSKVSNLLPSWELLDLPFLIENNEQLEMVLNSELKNRLLEELEEYHIKGLDFWANGFKQIAANKHPVLQTEHFKNLHIRVMNDKLLSEQMKLLGATPVVSDFDNVFTMMETEQINAQENTISNIYSKGFHTYEKYITLSNHGIMGYAILINEDFWDNLKPEYQQAILESLDEMRSWQFEQSKLINESSLNALKSLESVRIYTPTNQQIEQWKEKVRPIYKMYRSNGYDEYYSILLDLLNDKK